MTEPGKNNVHTLFIDHLNRVYCAKAHIIERLAEIADSVAFADLKSAITETILQIEKQVAVLDKVYALLHINHSFESCISMIGILDNCFIKIQQQGDNNANRNLAILSYMFFSESFETASFKILNILSTKTMNSEVKRLLSESLETSGKDRALLLVTAKKYLKN